MPHAITKLVQKRWFGLFARLVLTFVFWSAGLAGLFDFPAKVTEMRAVGLMPAEAFALAVTLVQLGGSLLVLSDRWTGLGAGMLGVFLALTIPIAHPFWTLDGPLRTQEFYIVLEHISLIGGLMTAAWNNTNGANQRIR